MLVGLLAGLAAGALGAADQLHPSGGWIAKRLADQGVQPGLLLLAAATALGGATLIASLTRLERRVAETGTRGDEIFDKVVSQVSVLRKSLHDFRTESLWLRETMTGLSEAVRDHIAQSEGVRQASASKEDGLFRVAASLDQLGERVEKRLERAADAQGKLPAQLAAQIAAQLAGELREQGAELERTLTALLSRTAAGRGHVDSFHAIEQAAPKDRGHSGRGLELTPAAGEAHGNDYHGAFDEPFVPAEEDLHIEVTLEDELDELGELDGALPHAEGEEAIDPRLFETSLGLLDAFDEFGAYREPKGPLPPGAGTPQASQEPAGQTPRRPRPER